MSGAAHMVSTGAALGIARTSACTAWRRGCRFSSVAPAVRGSTSDGSARWGERLGGSGLAEAQPPSGPRQPQHSFRRQSGAVAALDEQRSRPGAQQPPARDARIIYASAPSLGHHQEGHPESSERVPAILAALRKADLDHLARPGEIVELTDFEAAPRSAVAEVHELRYLHGLEKAMTVAADEGLVYLESSGPTFATAATYAEVMRAAGAGLAVVDAVVASASERHSSGGAALSAAGFALVRPPGHHAVPAGPMGFCLVDHVGVAARHAQRK
eukprot:SM000208S06317  [mRNA]  locus=s208:250330:252148:+ [translate_table: standard]